MSAAELGTPARIPLPSAIGAPRFVRAKKDGGANGDATHAPTYTYSIYRLDSVAMAVGDRLATGLTPLKGREEFGAYDYAPDGYSALAFIFNGVWYLWEVLEREQLIACAV